MAGGHVWQGVCAWWGVCMVGCVRGSGACVTGGMCGRGHAWQGGMHGRGVCMVGGGVVCGREVCMMEAYLAGGVRGGGHAWQGRMHGRGACVAGGGVRATPGRYYDYGIRLMSGMHSCVILFQHSMQDSCRGAGTPTLYLPMFVKNIRKVSWEFFKKWNERDAYPVPLNPLSAPCILNPPLLCQMQRQTIFLPL